jgi:uncharacterized hydrophobic protein (TIGR00271 family)
MTKYPTNIQESIETALLDQDEDVYHVVVAVGERGHLAPLLAIGCSVAKTRGGQVTVLSVTPDGERPGWLDVPDSHDGVPIDIQVKAGERPHRVILASIVLVPPDLLIVGWEGTSGRGRYILGSTLDPMLKRTPCTMLIVRVKSKPDIPSEGEPGPLQELEELCNRWQEIVVPAAGGPNAVLAIQQALDLGPDKEVTALYIARESLGDEAMALGHDRLARILEPWSDDERVKPKVIRAEDIIEGILDEAVHYDLLFLGATEDSMVERALFGNIPQRIASESAVPVIIVRRGRGRVNSLLRQLRWWIFEALPKLEISERAEIYLSIWRGARPRVDFFVMIGLAAVISALGLLQDSPAVIIGAMLVAPLMSAVIGVGLGVVQGDTRLLRVSLRAIARGAVIGIVMGTISGLLIGRDTPTAEILSRTRPTLLDLFVALMSGGAGAYALSRKGVSASLPGVAIAAALVPPLTAVGLSLSMGEIRLAGGALLLFLANLIAINAAGGLVFLWLGFGPGSSEHAQRSVLRRGLIGITVLLAIISVVLAVLTTNSLRVTGQERAIQRALVESTADLPTTEVVQWEWVDRASPVIYLEVILQSTQEMSREEALELQRDIAAELERPVALRLSVIPTQRLPALMPPEPTPTVEPQPGPQS